ncbi:unnamed protein product [Penicillium olsonii]|nr:unnamed protein product [Penicillium olsonii]
MGQVSLDTPELFPTKCCQEEIPMEEVVAVLGTRNRKRYISQAEEQAVPPEERMYCPRATCGQWIHPDSKGPRPGTRLCTHCRAKVCCACRDLAHGPWPCADDESLKTVLALAKDKKWQRCTKCHFIVEKVDGCNHISCRCGYHFCYICGGRQNKCKCPTEGTGEELAADGNLDVRTLVTAMQQADIQDGGIRANEGAR